MRKFINLVPEIMDSVMRLPRTALQKMAPIALTALLFGGCSIWPVEKRALSSNIHVRTSALKKIGLLPADRQKEVIAAMLRTISLEDDRLTNRAAEALVACGPMAVSPLVANLGVKDPYLRTLSVTILGDIGAPVGQVGPALVSALEDPHPLVREEAAHALSKLGPNAMGAVPALLMTLNDTNPGVREAARVALKRLGVKDLEPAKNSS
jgi:HEAT repeat protein